MSLRAGIARTCISPPWGVELAGLGYYLGRTWTRVRDHLAATAFVVDDGERSAVLIAVDLMYIDAAFVQGIRRGVSAATGIPETAVCVGCSHSHNTPTAALIRGAGEIDADYVAWAQRQAVSATVMAWQKRRPARMNVGKAKVAGWTYNRTRQQGAVDTRLTLWRADAETGEPLAAIVGFQGHPTIMMTLGSTDVSRDLPGVVTDTLEAAVPGLMAMHFQGACGDINFGEQWNRPETCREPGRYVAGKALEAFASARPVADSPARSGNGVTVGVSVCQVSLPTQRWSKEEIMADREEGLHRLKTGDTQGWRERIGRVMVNLPDRFPERYGGDLKLAVQAISRFAVEWTEQALRDVDTRPEHLVTEAQAVRVGDAFLVTNPAELFTSLALELRGAWPHDDLMIVGYANDGIGYLPDTYDIERRTYAANQSPKFKNQFPFTPESGAAMVAGMRQALETCSRTP